MGLPNILAIPEDGFQEFWFNHYQDHVDIVEAIQKDTGIKLTMYNIYPWLDSDQNGILEQHQQYHNDMNQLLGIAGSDLSDLDFQKKNEVKAWVYLNFQEHLNAHMALGI